MLVVHLTYTPLAGAPIRIVNALNTFTDVKARLINLNPNAYNSRVFPEDLIWQQDKNIALSLISAADIIVCHHPMDLVNNKFGINLKELAKPSCKFIQHFHSNRFVYGPSNPCLKGFNARAVIPHCPERSFLDVEILPNIIPTQSEELSPKKTENEIPIVAFSASTKRKRFERRWDTKGYPEVSSKLKKLSTKLGFKYVEIFGIPYNEAIKIRREADILIGDIVTGSFHLTEFEGLSQGKVVFCFLDGRSMQNFISYFKCNDCPFVNTSINDIEIVLKNLLKNKNLLSDIGNFSRDWITKYYNEENLVCHHVDFYQRVLKGEEVLRTDSDKFAEAKRFLYKDLYDLHWHNKRKESLSFFNRLFGKKLKY